MLKLIAAAPFIGLLIWSVYMMVLHSPLLKSTFKLCRLGLHDWDMQFPKPPYKHPHHALNYWIGCNHCGKRKP